jgi:di/tricarboxylate transporter
VTPDIGIVLAILAFAVTFFVTGWLRVDLVALLVLGALALSGILTPPQTLAGFSSPAVVIVAAMFVVSAALARTGVAGILGRQILRLAGNGEPRLVAVVVLTAGTLSSVMNNLGVVALMLPVVMDVARATGRPPSRLLIPLILGAHLGGLTTLIGTPPNILASDALRDQGLDPFGLFDFTPIGVALLLLGTVVIVTWGRAVLPARDPSRDEGEAPTLQRTIDLEERLFFIRVPRRSLLDGRTLAESRLGSALGLQVLAIYRDGETSLSPSPDAVLREGDRLLVEGRPDLLEELRERRHLVLETEQQTGERLVSAGIAVGEVRIPEDSPLVASTLHQADLRQKRGVVVIAIRRGGTFHRSDLQDIPLREGDVLLVQGPHESLADLDDARGFGELRILSPDEVLSRYRLEERFVSLRVMDDSMLIGRSLQESRLGDAAGLTVLGIMRELRTLLVPSPEERFVAGDVLLVKARPEDLATLRGLQKLEVEDAPPPPLSELESSRVGLVEVVLSPRSSLAGKTLRQASFRDRYGIDVLAVWRGGQAYRSNLRDMELRLGDALLLFGPRHQLRLLSGDPDFLVLTGLGQPPPDTRRAPVSALLLAGALLLAITGLIEIEIALLVAATAMVLTRCLPLDDAYRAIEWRALILIAGMLPLGTALGTTGAAALMAEGVVETAGAFGPRAVLAGLCLLTVLGAQVIPAAALVVLMAPVGLGAAAEVALSPQAVLMGIALSSAALASPVSHPANVLVMGPGGYRYADYLRVGLPLSVLVVVVVVIFVPLLFP